MQRSTIIILRIVYWILNVAIVGALIYMAVVGAFFLRKMNFSNFFGDLGSYTESQKKCFLIAGTCARCSVLHTCCYCLPPPYWSICCAHSQ